MRCSWTWRALSFSLRRWSTRSRSLTLPVVATLYFPVLIVGSMAGSIALITRGVSPELVTGLVIALAYLFLATLERWVPLHSEWSRSHGDVRADLSLGGTNAIVNFGTEPLVAAAATWGVVVVVA